MDFNECKYYLKAEKISNEFNQPRTYESAETNDLGDIDEDALLQEIIARDTLREQDTLAELEANRLEKFNQVETSVHMNGRVDAFIRGYLLSNNFTETLRTFQVEWFTKMHKGQLPKEAFAEVPDVYEENNKLREKTMLLEVEIEESRKFNREKSENCKVFKAERDYHVIKHRRLLQEKNMLVNELKKLRAHYAEYEPILRQLHQKYEVAMREKSLNRIERERAMEHVNELRSTLLSLQKLGTNEAGESKVEQPNSQEEVTSEFAKTRNQLLETRGTSQYKEKTQMHDSLPKLTSGNGVTEIPRDKGVNPLLAKVDECTAPGVCPASRKLNITIEGHKQAISSLSIHPTKPLLCSTSDDKCFKIWHIPELAPLLTIEAHKDWLASSDFNPKENILATTGGDSSIKLWRYDLGVDRSTDKNLSSNLEETRELRNEGNKNKASCVATLMGHAGPAWSVNWHWGGRFLISGGTDSTVRIWDTEMTKTVAQLSARKHQQCRTTFRKQAGTVNSVRFLPYGNVLVSASTDKTVAVWDVRAGACVQTLIGHKHPVTYALFNQQGTLISSCDTSGTVRLWDLRQLGPYGRKRSEEASSQKDIVDLTKGHNEQHPLVVNQLDFELNGDFLMAGCADAKIYCIEVATGLVTELHGQEDAVQSVVFDHQSNRLYSAGSDGLICGWW